jgi:Tfp pilus assembly protein PilO
MSDKKYKKRLEFQQKMISKKSEEIESLKLENEKLKQQIKEKDEMIAAIEPMRQEMTECIEKHRKLRNEYQKLIDEVKHMKEVMNKTVYKGRWWLVKLLIN